MQPPNSGSIEQVLRCLKLLAQSAALATEMKAVTSYMGSQAFTPGNFVDASGNTFALGMADSQFGDPGSWVPASFKQVLITHQLRPVPPYPLLMLLAAPGRTMPGNRGRWELDTGQSVEWIYVVDAVSVAVSDRPEQASRRALALSQGYERLVRRNEHLGGLVQLITAEGPPAPGGEVEQAKSGILSGVMQRFQVTVRAGLT